IVDGTVGAMACAAGRAAFLVSLLSHATSAANPTPRINRLKRLKAILLQTKRKHRQATIIPLSWTRFASNGSRGHSRVNQGSPARALFRMEVRTRDRALYCPTGEKKQAPESAGACGYFWELTSSAGAQTGTAADQKPPSASLLRCTNCSHRPH